MKISDKLSLSVYNNIQSHSKENIAINTYQGSSFKAMNTDTWSNEDHQYAQEHLAILSALYGLVRPYDTIGFYRLDFLMKFEIDLYVFWQDKITSYLNKKNTPIINLASQEYTEMIDMNQLTVPIYKVDFKETGPKGFVSKSTYAKIARGTATKLIIQNKIQSIDELKRMEFDSYRYNEAESNDNTLIFTR